ncbi:MAG: hypothetical protein CSYNP_02276 [Syntrophus sp. SKADARSKE-3]|nr:hypothetical protein [Syntrophus sp. SKADARSKE-3]
MKEKDTLQIRSSEDICSLTDLKRRTLEILDQVLDNRAPVIMSVNGGDGSVILDVRMYEKHIQAGTLAKLMEPNGYDNERDWKNR